jgi:iron complex transport system substrate-binding protein
MMGSDTGGATEIFSMPGFSMTPAATARSLFVRDGLYLIGFGPRAPDAARELMAAFYPDEQVSSPEAATGAALRDEGR